MESLKMYADETLKNFNIMCLLTPPCQFLYYIKRIIRNVQNPCFWEKKTLKYQWRSDKQKYQYMCKCMLMSTYFIENKIRFAKYLVHLWLVLIASLKNTIHLRWLRCTIFNLSTKISQTYIFDLNFSTLS